jgi:hypothetical protein
MRDLEASSLFKSRWECCKGWTEEAKIRLGIMHEGFTMLLEIGVSLGWLRVEGRRLLVSGGRVEDLSWASSREIILKMVVLETT